MLSAIVESPFTYLFSTFLYKLKVDEDEDVKDDNDETNDAVRFEGDIYIMMQCVFVCNEKSSLPPGSLL